MKVSVTWILPDLQMTSYNQWIIVRVIIYYFFNSNKPDVSGHTYNNLSSWLLYRPKLAAASSLHGWLAF